MKVGDLVRMTVSRTDVKAGSLGLIVGKHRNNFDEFWIYTVEAVVGSESKSFLTTSSTIEKV